MPERVSEAALLSAMRKGSKDLGAQSVSEDAAEVGGFKAIFIHAHSTQGLLIVLIQRDWLQIYIQIAG